MYAIGELQLKWMQSGSKANDEEVAEQAKLLVCVIPPYFNFVVYIPLPLGTLGVMLMLPLAHHYWESSGLHAQVGLV